MFEGARQVSRDLDAESLARKMGKRFEKDAEIAGFIGALFDKSNIFNSVRFPREYLLRRAQENDDAGVEKMAQWLRELAQSPESDQEIAKRFQDRAEHMRTLMRDDEQMRRIARIVIAALK